MLYSAKLLILLLLIIKSSSVSYSKMENVPMAPHCYMGRHSFWHLCWVAPRSECQRSMLSCKQGSSEQDCKVWRALCLSHLFASGSWNCRHLNQSAVELIQEIGRRITAVTKDTREMVFLFQRLSIVLQRGMQSSSWLHSTPCDTPSWSLFLLSLIFTSAALCWWPKK